MKIQILNFNIEAGYKKLLMTKTGVKLKKIQLLLKLKIF